MMLDFDEPERDAAARLIHWALEEDLEVVGDVTSRALIDGEQRGTVQVVARTAGVLAGGPVGKAVFKQVDPHVKWDQRIEDGAALQPGDVIAHVTGPLRSLLTGERTALNFLTHLSGVATLTRRFVEAVAGTGAAILDTRKTLPGFRVLQKYAVRAGGGVNHRTGLYDAILIKDNHLAAWAAHHEGGSIAEAVRAARDHVPYADFPIQVEVDSLEQLADALAGKPNVVLLDNMDIATMRQAVALRNKQAPEVQLEASGGVTLATVRAVAETGVERISIGALTHSAAALDIGFDWAAESE